MYVIQWRGKITRDVGRDFYYALNIKLARQNYKDAYPMRVITGITVSKNQGRQMMRPVK